MLNQPEVPTISTPDPRVKTLHDLHGIPTETIAEILGNPTASPHMARALSLSLGETLPKSGALYPAIDTPLSERVRRKFKLSTFEGTNPAFPGATIMGNCTVDKCTPIAMQNAVSSGEIAEERVGDYTRSVRERVVSFTGGKLGDGKFMYFDQSLAQRLGKLPANRGAGDSWETMNAAVKGDNSNYYNLTRILQIPLAGWVRPSDEQLFGVGDYAVVWSSGDGEDLYVSTNGVGDVGLDSYRRCGRSARILDTK